VGIAFALVTFVVGCSAPDRELGGFRLVGSNLVVGIVRS